VQPGEVEDPRDGGLRGGGERRRLGGRAERPGGGLFGGGAEQVSPARPST
jgi:hypothetical protein